MERINSYKKIVICFAIIMIFSISFASADFQYNALQNNKISCSQISGSTSDLCTITSGVGNGTDTWVGNQSSYFTKTNILNFGYYNLSSFNINNYYPTSNPSSYISASSLSPYLLISNWNATNLSYLDYNNKQNLSLDMGGSDVLHIGTLSAHTILPLSVLNIMNSTDINGGLQVVGNLNFPSGMGVELGYDQANHGFIQAMNRNGPNGIPLLLNYDIGNVIMGGTFSNVNGSKLVANVGINTTTPQNTLNVVGDINFTGFLYGNGSQLTNLPQQDLSSYVLNSTLNNGTYIINSILNNGSYFNTASSDTFIANYSAFLNKISWSGINNNTIALVSNLTNLVNWANANNGTISDTNKVSWINANNGTITDPNKVFWLNVGNGTLATTNSIWTTLSNGTMALNSTLGNIANWNTAYTLGTNNTFAGLNSTWVSWLGVSNKTLIINNGTTTGTFNISNSTGFRIISWTENRSIIFDDSNFVWDAVNNRLGLGTASPQTLLDVNGNMNVSGNGNFTSTMTITVFRNVIGTLATNGTAGFCGTTYNGSMMRNSSGVWGCQSIGRWKLLY